MAVDQSGPLIHITSATVAATEVKTLISYILFTPDAAFDTLVLRGSANGPDVVTLRAAVAKDTKVYDFSRKPLVFPNGVYIQTLTSGAKATLVTTQAGG